MKDSPYYPQVRLLLEVLPHIAKETCFALKGGTAINLFLWDMPRLSVDIDLTYLPLENRETFFDKLEESLQRIENSIKNTIPGVQIQKLRFNERGRQRTYKLMLKRLGALVKIEPNLTLRGSVFSCEERELVQVAQDTFELTTSITTLSQEDIYGGKICAALDRQHPRDFFDIKILLDKKELTEKVRKAFVVYLANSDRPMSELLEPKPQDFRRIFESEFLGMTLAPVTYEELVEARSTLFSKIKAELSFKERKFLLSVKQGQPDWGLLEIDGIDKLPGIQWKLINIGKMDRKKHQAALDKLRRVLEL